MTVFQVTITQRQPEFRLEESLSLRPTKLKPTVTRKGLKTCVFHMPFLHSISNLSKKKMVHVDNYFFVFIFNQVINYVIVWLFNEE